MTSPRRPNVLWFITDQQRHDALGCAGNPAIRTPHLDRLAADGVRFARHYVTNPVCLPSRASLLTGRYPHAHGSWRNQLALRPSETTLPAVLAEQGYATALFGKLHLTSVAQQYQEGVEQEIESIHRNRGVPDAEVDRFWRSWFGPFYGFQHAELTVQHGERIVGGGHYGQWLHDYHPEAVHLYDPERALAARSGAPQSWKAAIPAELHHSNWIADRTIDYLEKHAGAAAASAAGAAGIAGTDDGAVQPFFLFCGFPDPHRPQCPPAPYCDMYDPQDLPLPAPNRGELERMPPHHRAYYERYMRMVPDPPAPVRLRDLPEAYLRELMAHYYGMVTLMDDAVGRVLAALDRLGLAEDTIVLFTSDHGELMGDHGLLFKGPYHYESVIRVPLLWRWPGVIPAGGTYEGISSGVDIMPTLLEACGVPRVAGVQGESALGALRGGGEPHRSWALVEHRESVRGLQAKTVVTKDHKLTYYAGEPYGELFDLGRDPQEYDNLWDVPDHRGLRDALTVRLLDVLCRTEDQLPETPAQEGQGGGSD